MTLGSKAHDLPWRQSEPPDYPTAEEIALEVPRPMDPIEAGWEEREDVPEPPEDAWIDAALEDALSGPEPYEGNPYDGTDNSDPGFYSDSGDADWGDSLADDDLYNDWGGEV